MNGIIIVNKPKDFTSNDVVQKIKRILGEKVGHTGTLDPNATGVLPLLIGKGTLLSKYLINHDKKYEAVLKLGEKRNTADIEGSVIEEKEVNSAELSENNIKDVFNSLIGKQEQVPPMYSAIKVRGKKLYEYARSGKTIEIPTKEITIYNLELKNTDIEDKEITFIVECSKGTYIRTLCETIAEKLNTVGFMKDLKRLKVGDFKIEDSHTIEEIENGNYNIITVEEFFKDKPKVNLTDKKLSLFLNGVMLETNLKDGLYRIYNENDVFIGIGEVKNKLLKRDIIC